MKLIMNEYHQQVIQNLYSVKYSDCNMTNALQCITERVRQMFEQYRDESNLYDVIADVSQLIHDVNP